MNISPNVYAAPDALTPCAGGTRSHNPSLTSFPSVNPSEFRVTFEKVTVTFFVTFFSCVFPSKNPSKRHLLLCDLFWKGMPSAHSHNPTHTPNLTPSLTLTPSACSPPTADIRSLATAFRAYPRLTAPDRAKIPLNSTNRAKNFSGGSRASAVDRPL